MIRLMEILNIYLEDWLLIKYYVIKHLILQNIPNMTDVNVHLLHWFIYFLNAFLNKTSSATLAWPETLAKRNKFAVSGVRIECQTKN